MRWINCVGDQLSLPGDCTNLSEAVGLPHSRYFYRLPSLLSLSTSSLSLSLAPRVPARVGEREREKEGERERETILSGLSCNNLTELF